MSAQPVTARPVMAHPLSRLMLFLTGLYAAGGRPGAGTGGWRDCPRPPVPPAAPAALGLNPHPVAQLLADALPYLRWFDDTNAIARKKPDAAVFLLANKLVGPEGQFPAGGLRVGIYVQAPNVDYTLRSHAAEETYILPGGHSFWSVGDAPLAPRETGEVVFHPSMIPHRTVTTDAPLIAAWRWSGQISFDSYNMLEPA